MPPALSQKDQRSYRGVRQRSWGKWVSEVREPKKRSRIWLGSYHTQEAAARAYDTALVYLRGPSARLNFPNSPPAVPLSDAYPAASPKSIQRAALEEGSRFDKHLNAQAGAASFPEIDAVAVQLATTADAQRKSGRPEGPRKSWDDAGLSPPSEAPSEREQKTTDSSVGARFLCRPEDTKPLAIVPYVLDERKDVTASEPSADGYGSLSYLSQESMTTYSPENERKLIRSCVTTPFSSALAAQQRMPMPDAPPGTEFSRFAGFCLLPIATDHPPWWPSADEICD